MKPFAESPVPRSQLRLLRNAFPTLCLAATAVWLSGCRSTPLRGVNPAAPPISLVEAGWKSSWSPDGRRLAYGTGQGDRLEVLDLRTREKMTLVNNAKDATWSPDGRWIAFIREASYNQYLTEEVWVIPAQGGEPRRLVGGGFPSWSANGRTLFVHSRREGHLLAVDPAAHNSQPVIFYTNAPAWYFSVSPDQTRVAFGCQGHLDIRDRATGKSMAAVSTPRDRGLLPAWSPDGKWVAFGGFDDSRLGLWILDVATGRAKLIRAGHCTMPAWSRDGRWLSFDDRAGSRSVWIVGRRFLDGVLKPGAGLGNHDGPAR